MSPRTRAGAALIALGLGLGFNVPYAALGMTFGYPDVLRLPAGEVLTRFAAGGPGLVLTWYAFTLSALLMTAAAGLLAIEQARHGPAAAAVGITGALAGLLQAIGLARWVFAVPGMARAYVDPAVGEAGRAGLEAAFLALNSYGGVAIGEHLGQLLTAAWVAGVATGQVRMRRTIGLLTAALILAGTGEGLALALGGTGAAFGPVTAAGYLLLTAWLLLTGAGLLRPAHVIQAPARPPSGPQSGRPAGASLMPLLAVTMAVLLGGCATGEAGIRGRDAFVAGAATSEVASPRGHLEFARCFEERGAFLPFTTFDRAPDASEVTYRLAAAGWHFEEVAFRPAGAGSVALIRVAPNLDDRWRAGMERDRIAPLQSCAARVTER